MSGGRIHLADCELLLKGLKAIADVERSSGMNMMVMEAMLAKRSGETNEESAQRYMDRIEQKAARVEESLLALRVKLVQLRNRLSEHRS
jgi:hypothetical protein